MAERLIARVFGKRNASATKTKTTIHNIASIFIRVSILAPRMFRAAIMREAGGAGAVGIF